MLERDEMLGRYICSRCKYVFILFYKMNRIVLIEIFYFLFPIFLSVSSVIDEGHIKYKGESYHCYHFSCYNCR